MIKFDITLISYQISLIHESFFQLPNVSSAGQSVVNLLISNSQVLHKKSDGEDEPLPSSLGLALCSPEMSFNFLVQKTNRSKEAPVLNERIASFKNSQDGKGPFMKIFNKDSVDRHITAENFKGFRVVDAELLIQVSTTGCKDYPFIASSGQEFNTLKFLLKLIRGEVAPGNLLDSYPRTVLFYGTVLKLINGRWSERFIMIIPHRLYSFANFGVEVPRNVVPLRNATIQLTRHHDADCIQIDHASLAAPFIFKHPDSLMDAEVMWALKQAFRYTKSSPLFSSAAVAQPSSSTSKATAEPLPLDQFLIFSVKVSSAFATQPSQFLIMHTEI